ncbi:MAG: hypothetical protein ACK4NT_04910 [Candidatus Omnitrophota bacterium]
MKRITYLIFLLATLSAPSTLSTEKGEVFRRLKVISSPEFIFSHLKSQQLLSTVKEDVYQPEIQKILSDLRKAGIKKIYFIELPSLDPKTATETNPSGGKNFPEVQDLLKKELGIEIKEEDSGVILLPFSLVNEKKEKRIIILLHELTHILKDADPEIGREEFEYYQKRIAELSNLKLDNAAGDEGFTPLEEKFLDELLSTLGNFILMRYLIAKNFLSYVSPYLEIKIENYSRKCLEETTPDEEKEMLFKLAYFLSVIPFRVLNNTSEWEKKLKELFKAHLPPERIEEIITKVFIPLTNNMKDNPYPTLQWLRRYFF